MHLGVYIGLVHDSEKDMAEALKMAADKHGDEPDIFHMCQLLASWSEEHVQGLKPFVERYSEKNENEGDRLMKSLFNKARTGSLGMLRDLHDLWLMGQEVRMSWKVVLQAAQLLRDKDLESACYKFQEQTNRQIAWLETRIKQAAPQTLVVAS